MTAKFRKTSTKRPKHVPRKLRAAPKKPNKAAPKTTPVMRVGPERDQHDTIASRALYVLVDQPTAPEDSVDLDRGTKPWPKMFTTDAQPLHDATLVYILTFENVPDAGKLTLTYERGESRAAVALFTDVDAKDLFLDDIDLLYDFDTMQSKDARSNQRFLDYHVVPQHPMPDDKDLDWPEPPYASLTESGT